MSFVRHFINHALKGTTSVSTTLLVLKLLTVLSLVDVLKVYSMFDLEMHLIDPPHYRIYIKLAKFTLYKCNLPIIRHILIFNIGISKCWSQVYWDKCQWIPGEYYTVYRLDNLYWIVSSVIFDMNMTANQSIMTKIMALRLIMSSEYKLTKF